MADWVLLSLSIVLILAILAARHDRAIQNFRHSNKGDCNAS